MKVEFRDWDDRIATLHILYHVVGPITGGFPVDHYAAWAVYLSLGRNFPDADKVEAVVQKLMEGKPLDGEDKELLAVVERIQPPAWMKEGSARGYELLKREWERWGEKVKGALSFFPSSIFERRVLAYPSVEMGGCGGSGYGGIGLVMSFSPWEDRSCFHAFLHELIHVLNSRWSELKETLKSRSRELGLPLEEAWTESLTNLVEFEIGLKRQPFTSYYNKRWKELVALEDKLREKLLEWWKRGRGREELLELLNKVR